MKKINSTSKYDTFSKYDPPEIYAWLICIFAIGLAVNLLIGYFLTEREFGYLIGLAMCIASIAGCTLWEKALNAFKDNRRMFALIVWLVILIAGTVYYERKLTVPEMYYALAIELIIAAITSACYYKKRCRNIRKRK